MLARYLGSKQEILPAILTATRDKCPPGAHIVDAFSGSLAVSLGLKRSGYQVSANDVNQFSRVLADAYLIPTELHPMAVSVMIRNSSALDKCMREAGSICELLIGNDGFSFLDDEKKRAQYIEFVALLVHLATIEDADIPPTSRFSFIYDSYCEAGSNSAYTSSRGRSGRRRFFSPDNARRIDLILNQLRAWQFEGILPRPTASLLISVLMRATEKVANTQGTFHDFPREKWDSRAFKPLRLNPPPLDDLYAGPPGNNAGHAEDSLEWIKSVPAHDLLYLDPPYNFRQYTAYYFLPNILCQYPYLLDPGEYFSKIKYVRGQNPEDDFVSTFCKPRRFIEDMGTLIERARTDYVMISYFNGRNHWGSFDSDPTDTGRLLLTEMLEGPGFMPGSLEVVEIPRTNYASYGGFRARSVSELLLVARKRQDLPCAPEDRAKPRIQTMAR